MEAMAISTYSSKEDPPPSEELPLPISTVPEGEVSSFVSTPLIMDNVHNSHFLTHHENENTQQDGITPNYSLMRSIGTVSFLFSK